jgi:hypothetical protein
LEKKNKKTCENALMNTKNPHFDNELKIREDSKYYEAYDDKHVFEFTNHLTQQITYIIS